MKQLFKSEFGRAIGSNYMLMALTIGCLITVSHVLQNVLPLDNMIYSYGYPITVFEKWIGGENASMQPALYYLLVPIIVSMPYMATMYQDRKTGYIKNVFIRINKTKYYLVKYIVTFVTSGAVAVLPLLLNFLLSAMILPATIPQPSTGFYSIYATSMLGNLFYMHPFVYLLIYSILDFVFFGLLASMGLLISFIAENIFVVMLNPFILYLLVFAATQLTDLHAYCPYSFLRPSQPVPTTGAIVLTEIGIMILIGGLVYLYVGRKKETY